MFSSLHLGHTIDAGLPHPGVQHTKAASAAAAAIGKLSRSRLESAREREAERRPAWTFWGSRVRAPRWAAIVRGAGKGKLPAQLPSNKRRQSRRTPSTRSLAAPPQLQKLPPPASTTAPARSPGPAREFFARLL